MVNLKYFTSEISLEDFHLEGPAIVAGLDRKEAIIFSEKVMKELRKDKVSVISFYDLIKYSSKFLSGRVKKKYIILNQYFLAAYSRKIKDPFFIFLGGTASSGKDLLVSDLQNLLGIDRITPADYFRELVRTELIEKYGSIKKVPDKLQPLFLTMWRVDKKGMNLQIEAVKKRVYSKFLKEALRECRITGGFHPFFILYGIHIVPGIEKKIKRKNKLLFIINPSEKALRQRIYSRQEKEHGPVDERNREQRERECQNTVVIKEFLEKEAKKYGSLIISEDNRLKVFHKFGDELIKRLESILIEEGVVDRELWEGF